MLADFESMGGGGPLLGDPAPNGCRACVVVPARNEEDRLLFCLDALQRQVDLEGEPVPAECFEVLLLLNNCTDGSAEVARTWCAERGVRNVHVVERTLARPEAHVGTARALLMETAASRLGHDRAQGGAILSTDADTVVAPDWLAQNLRSLAEGADVVGGAVELRAAELRSTSPAVRRCYEQDRLYASLIARLEDVLDPQPGDPWPRHLDHFGSSLACTTAAYVKAGGMPAVTPLEDEAFVDGVRRAGLRLRHDPRVRVFTSARLDGRAETGMAGQLRCWAHLLSEDEHEVTSAAYLEHRFRTLRRLRDAFESGDHREIVLPTAWWRETFGRAMGEETTCAAFLGAVYCDTLIEESFEGMRVERIRDAIAKLRARLGVEV